MPEIYRHLPSGAVHQIVLPPIRSAWEIVSYHIGDGMIISRNMIDEWMLDGIGADWGEFQAIAAHQCLFGSGLEVLSRFGVDVDREIGVGIYDPIVFGSESSRKFGLTYLVVFFSRDVDSLLQNALRISVGDFGTKLTLHQSNEDMNPTGFLIRRTMDSDFGNLCSVVEEKMIGAEAVRVSVDDTIVFVRDPSESGNLNISCDMLSEGGTSSGCLCELGAGDVRPCISGFEYESNDMLLDTLTTLGSGENPVQLVHFGGGHSLAIAEDGVAALSNDRSLLRAALLAPLDNFSRNFNNGNVRDLQELRTRGETLRELGSGVWRLVGALNLGSMKYLVSGDRDTLEVAISVNAGDPTTRFMTRVLEPSEDPFPSATMYTRSAAGVLLSDRSTPYFLRYFLEFLWRVPDELNPALDNDKSAPAIGNLQLVIDEVARAGASNFAFHVVGARDGLPMLVFALSIEDESTGRGMIRAVQRRLREARDEAILEEALSLFVTNPRHLKVDMDVLTDRRLSGIISETPSSWDAYLIEDEGIVRVSELDDDLFESTVMELAEETIEVHYLDPGFTMNDLLFRLYEFNLSKEDLEALKRNERRFVAFHDVDDGVLWFGLDFEALNLALSGRIPSTGWNEIETETDVPLVHDAKLIAELDPRWLTEEGSTHPIEEVSREVEALWLDFEGYRTILATVLPDGNTNGLLVQIRFAR